MYQSSVSKSRLEEKMYQSSVSKSRLEEQMYQSSVSKSRLEEKMYQSSAANHIGEGIIVGPLYSPFITDNYLTMRWGFDMTHHFILISYLKDQPQCTVVKTLRYIFLENLDEQISI